MRSKDFLVIWLILKIWIPAAVTDDEVSQSDLDTAVQSSHNFGTIDAQSSDNFETIEAHREALFGVNPRRILNLGSGQAKNVVTPFPSFFTSQRHELASAQNDNSQQLRRPLNIFGHYQSHQEVAPAHRAITFRPSPPDPTPLGDGDFQPNNQLIPRDQKLDKQEFSRPLHVRIPVQTISSEQNGGKHQQQDEGHAEVNTARHRNREAQAQEHFETVHPRRHKNPPRESLIQYLYQSYLDSLATNRFRPQPNVEVFPRSDRNPNAKPEEQDEIDANLLHLTPPPPGLFPHERFSNTRQRENSNSRLVVPIQRIRPQILRETFSDDEEESEPGLEEPHPPLLTNGQNFEDSRPRHFSETGEFENSPRRAPPGETRQQPKSFQSISTSVSVHTEPEVTTYRNIPFPTNQRTAFRENSNLHQSSISTHAGNLNPDETPVQHEIQNGDIVIPFEHRQRARHPLELSRQIQNSQFPVQKQQPFPTSFESISHLSPVLRSSGRPNLLGSGEPDFPEFPTDEETSSKNPNVVGKSLYHQGKSVGKFGGLFSTMQVLPEYHLYGIPISAQHTPMNAKTIPRGGVTPRVTASSEVKQGVASRSPSASVRSHHEPTIKDRLHQVASRKTFGAERTRARLEKPNFGSQKYENAQVNVKQIVSLEQLSAPTTANPNKIEPTTNTAVPTRPSLRKPSAIRKLMTMSRQRTTTQTDKEKLTVVNDPTARSFHDIKARKVNDPSGRSFDDLRNRKVNNPTGQSFDDLKTRNVNDPTRRNFVDLTARKVDDPTGPEVDMFQPAVSDGEAPKKGVKKIRVRKPVVKKPRKFVANQPNSADITPTQFPTKYSSRFRDEAQPQILPTTIPTHEMTENFRSKPASDRPFSSTPRRLTTEVTRTSKPIDTVSDLPSSVLLSPKDVIRNRKPARRIPSDSFSQRLRTLKTSPTRNLNFGETGENSAEDGNSAKREVKSLRFEKEKDKSFVITDRMPGKVRTDEDSELSFDEMSQILGIPKPVSTVPPLRNFGTEDDETVPDDYADGIDTDATGRKEAVEAPSVKTFLSKEHFGAGNSKTMQQHRQYLSFPIVSKSATSKIQQK